MDAFPPNTHPPTGDAHLDAAIRAIGAGDPQTLTTMLDDQPDLVHRRIEGHEEYGRGYFTRPQLHHFTAFNPWWHDDTVVPPQTPRILELLLDRGADPESLCGPDDDPDQWTVLGLITSGMKTREADIEDALLDVLQAAGARRNTPMHQAAWADQPEILADLIRAGGRPDVRDDHHGGTPLDWAQHGNHTRALEVLRDLAR